MRVLMEADIDAEIGARLAEVRRRCGLTQRQLAKAVGVQLTTVPKLGAWAHRAPCEAPGRARASMRQARPVVKT